MANTLLTPTKVTNEALMILHQKLNFIGSINTTYDDQYAQEGAKIGDTLKLRLPNEYTVRTGATLATQDTTESSVDLTVATQKGVDVNFTTKELTMDIQDFSDRILEPAMSVLAANIEADALSMYKDVWNMYDDDGNAISLASILQGRKILNDNLAPLDNKRSALLSNAHSATLVNALSGLFQDSTKIAKQYSEGMMGRTAGLNFMESSLVVNHTTGTAATTTGYSINGAGQSGSTITIDGGTTSFLKGDIIQIGAVNLIHPETKAVTGSRRNFVVTADSGTNATSLSISPAIVTSGGGQNVSAGPVDNALITKVGAGASGVLTSSMVYHKNAFSFATADLIKPRGVDFCARKVLDGISMRIVRQYDINNDKMPCRIDVLYGYKASRPQMACRIHADG